MRFLRVLLLLLFSGVAAGVSAQAIPVRDLAVLVDRTATESIASASAPAAQARYAALSGAFGAGYTRDVHWLRFTVQAPSAGEWWLEVQPPFLDDLRLFEPGDAGFVERRAGDRLPFKAREEDYRAFVFKLMLPDTAPRTFYLRLQTTSTSMATLQLWPPERFHAAKNAEYAALGFYYGFFAVLLLLNLILWAGLREALYGWFALHVLASIVLYFGANGLASQYLLREAPRIADLWVGAAVLLSIAAAAPFYRRMLRIERDQRSAFALFRLQVAVPCVLIVPLAAGYYTEAVRAGMIIVLPLFLVSLFLSFRLWRQGRDEGLYILAANGFSLLGAMASVLAVLGINPGDLLSIGVRQFTFLGNILAMCIALALRIRSMHGEQRQALERADDAETDAAHTRQAHAEQGRFIAMVSHELKTPLAVIDGAAQALARLDRSNDPEVTRRHERIRRSVTRIDRLVEQFLTTDRLDTESMNVRRLPVDLPKLLGEVAETSADGAERLRLTVPAALWLAADGALLRLAVANLVDNALKYAPRDSTVTLSGAPRQEKGVPGIEIVVADDGPGIAPELHAQVFSRYTRGDHVGHVSGAGLGLYLVRRIAELHGGRVDLSPHPGGAVFRLWLPSGAETAA